MSHVKRLILGFLCIQMIAPANAQASEFEKIKELAWNYGTDVCTAVNFFYELAHPPSLRKMPAKKLSQHNKKACIKALLCVPVAIGMRMYVFPNLAIKDDTSWPKTFGLICAQLACGIPETLSLEALRDMWFIARERNKRKSLKKKKVLIQK